MSRSTGKKSDHISVHVFHLITGCDTRLTLTLDMSLQKASIGKNTIPLLGPKIWDKIHSFIYGVKTKPSLNHLWETEILKEVTVERFLFSVNTTLLPLLFYLMSLAGP